MLQIWIRIRNIFHGSGPRSEPSSLPSPLLPHTSSLTPPPSLHLPHTSSITPLSHPCPSPLLPHTLSHTLSLLNFRRDFFLNTLSKFLKFSPKVIEIFEIKKLYFCMFFHYMNTAMNVHFIFYLILFYI